MAVSDGEIDELARRMFAEHGQGAAFAAGERLNECIDERDWRGRDKWARVVRRIHQIEGECGFG